MIAPKNGFLPVDASMTVRVDRIRAVMGDGRGAVLIAEAGTSYLAEGPYGEAWLQYVGLVPEQASYTEAELIQICEQQMGVNQEKP